LNKKPRIKTQAKPRKGLSNRGGGAENQRKQNQRGLGRTGQQQRSKG